MNNGEESETQKQEGGTERDISFFDELCLCALPSESAGLCMSKKNMSRNDQSHQAKTSLYWTTCLDKLFVPAR